MKVEKIALGIGVLLFGIYIMAQALTKGGNVLGNIALYFSIGSFLFGMVQPKAGAYLMIFFAAYIDMLKRFLAVDYHLSMHDSATILSIPLALMLGICSGLAAKAAMGKVKIPMFPFIVANCFVIGIVGAMLLKSSGGLGGIFHAVNAGSYLVLIWVFPTLFVSRWEIRRFILWTVIIFVPVGMVGIKQQFFGYSDIETAYLMSGLTIEIKQLTWEGIRPFATMAAPGSFSGLMSICALLVIYLHKTRKEVVGKDPILSSVRFLCLFRDL